MSLSLHPSQLSFPVIVDGVLRFMGTLCLGTNCVCVVEAIVKTVPQYRFYATSLLFLYDGATQEEIDDVDPDAGIKYSPDVRIKLIDFAHAITDLHANDVITAPFQPQHPDNPDKGYLKGLSSLKTYFKRYTSP